jgi:hypothetical protein
MRELINKRQHIFLLGDIYGVSISGLRGKSFGGKGND